MITSVRSILGGVGCSVRPSGSSWMTDLLMLNRVGTGRTK